MKKIIYYLLTALFITSMLTGCIGQEDKISIGKPSNEQESSSISDNSTQEDESSDQPDTDISQIVYDESSFIGKWECIESGESDTFIFTLDFKEDGTVEYMAGWYQSEIAAIYSGTYTVSDNLIYFMLTDTEDQSNIIEGSFTFSFEDNLTLIFNEGTPLRYSKQNADYMVFTYSDI